MGTSLINPIVDFKGGPLDGIQIRLGQSQKILEFPAFDGKYMRVFRLFYSVRYDPSRYLYWYEFDRQDLIHEWVAGEAYEV
jgi:hypothetical protein